MISSVLIRLDAGNICGYGHLSRCLSLADELLSDTNVRLLIKTDDEVKVLDFINKRSSVKHFQKIEFLGRDTDSVIDFSEIQKRMENNCFLILDHYNINESFQRKLKKENIRWLQFDSHARIRLYADIVLHPSPGADPDRYRRLAVSGETQLLIGAEYAIVNSKLMDVRKRVKPRKRLSRILICFGGGDDRGATVKLLKSLDEDQIRKIQFDVIISDKNNDLEMIKELCSDHANTELHINSDRIEYLMEECDLGIISPGTLSYESAFLGLPMLLVIIADNQVINATGWVKSGCALSIGEVSSINKADLYEMINKFQSSSPYLKTMSSRCLSMVDGLGVKRIKDIILNI